MSRHIFIDLETGGLDPTRCGITQIAAIAFDLDMSREEPVMEINRFNSWIKQDPKLAYEPGALRYQSGSLDYLRHHGVEERHVLGSLMWFMRDNDPTPGVGCFWAHSAEFDHSFIVAAQKRHIEAGINLTSYSPTWACTRALFIQLGVFGLHNSPWVSLKNCCKTFGVDFYEDKAHNALYDADRGLALLNTMLKRLRSAFGAGADAMLAGDRMAEVTV